MDNQTQFYWTLNKSTPTWCYFLANYSFCHFLNGSFPQAFLEISKEILSVGTVYTILREEIQSDTSNILERIAKIKKHLVAQVIKLRKNLGRLHPTLKLSWNSKITLFEPKQNFFLNHGTNGRFALGATELYKNIGTLILS